VGNRTGEYLGKRPCWLVDEQRSDSDDRASRTIGAFDRGKVVASFKLKSPMLSV